MNQQGFATLEVALVATIISLLAFVAVPKMNQVLDKIYLKYEVERFCSELEYARSAARSTSAPKSEIFSENSAIPSGEVLVVNLEYANNSYSVKKNAQLFRERHMLGGGIVLQQYSSAPSEIIFKAKGTSKSGTVRFTSRLGEVKSVTIDSVGRVRIKDD